MNIRKGIYKGACRSVLVAAAALAVLGGINACGSTERFNCVYEERTLENGVIEGRCNYPDSQGRFKGQRAQFQEYQNSGEYFTMIFNGETWVSPELYSP